MVTNKAIGVHNFVIIAAQTATGDVVEVMDLDVSCGRAYRRSTAKVAI
jgi:hypothetical protein